MKASEWKPKEACYMNFKIKAYLKVANFHSLTFHAFDWIIVLVYTLALLRL